MVALRLFILVYIIIWLTVWFAQICRDEMRLGKNEYTQSLSHLLDIFVTQNRIFKTMLKVE